jgi:hypothetical protein
MRRNPAQIWTDRRVSDLRTWRVWGEKTVNCEDMGEDAPHCKSGGKSENPPWKGGDHQHHPDQGDAMGLEEEPHPKQQLPERPKGGQRTHLRQTGPQQKEDQPLVECRNHPKEARAMKQNRKRREHDWDRRQQEPRPKRREPRSIEAPGPNGEWREGPPQKGERWSQGRRLEMPRCQDRHGQ